jgi:hypothetical protein
MGKIEQRVGFDSVRSMSARPSRRASEMREAREFSWRSHEVREVNGGRVT